MKKVRKTPQHSLSFKVSGEEKNAFADRCAKAGMSQTELLERLVFGRMPDEQPMAAVAREHISLIHALRAAIADGHPIDPSQMEELLAATRAMITAVRRNILS